MVRRGRRGDEPEQQIAQNLNYLYILFMCGFFVWCVLVLWWQKSMKYVIVIN